MAIQQMGEEKYRRLEGMAEEGRARTAAGTDELVVVMRWRSDVVQMVVGRYTRKNGAVVEDQKKIVVGMNHLVLPERPEPDVAQMMERSLDPHMRRQ